MVTALTEEAGLGDKERQSQTLLAHLKHNQVKKFPEKEPLFISHLSSTHLEYKPQSCCLNPTSAPRLSPPGTRHAGSHLSSVTRSALGVMATPTPLPSTTSHDCLRIRGNSPVSRKHTLILFAQRRRKERGREVWSEGACTWHGAAAHAEREGEGQGYGAPGSDPCCPRV